LVEEIFRAHSGLNLDRGFSMKVGVVSDTHGRALPEQLLNDFKNVDLIMHAGDLGSWEIYTQLAELAEVKAVSGNMDSPQIAKRLPIKEIIACGRFHLGLVHGVGAPQGLIERVREQFKHKKVDAVIFGHSHEPCNVVVDNILFFNPGSPNDTVFSSTCTYGLLEISEKGIKGKIVKVKA
jgi:uncharacterized protein